MEELNRKSVSEFRQSDKIPVVVVLENIRSAYNVGSVFRTADAFLLENDVAPDGGRGLVFPQFHDAIGACGILADHLENDHWFVGNGGIRIRSSARNQCVRIANFARRLDFHIGAMWSAGLACETGIERLADVVRDLVVRDRPAGHCHRLKSVELVTEFLARLPNQELRHSHRLA